MRTIEELTTPEDDFAEEDAKHFHKGNGKAAPAPAGEAMPQLPDDFGLDYDDIRGMLAQKHGTAVGLDDPLMMVVSLMNVFLGELEKVNKRHNEAVTKIMADQTGQYIAGVKATTDDLGKVLADNSVEAIRRIFNSHDRALNAHTNNAKWCAAIMAITGLVNVAALALRAW
jgi:hypothetical protein